jgi:hypothetical protein
LVNPTGSKLWRFKYRIDGVKDGLAKRRRACPSPTALGACVLAWGLGAGLVAWCGWLTAAALAVSWLLSLFPR